MSKDRFVDLRDRDLAVLHRTFRRFPYVREVRLFGSRATGHARRASDIDLAISAPDATAEQWLDLKPSNPLRSFMNSISCAPNARTIPT